ncbi:unnamed protein product [Bursaphelenchus okinawaensis]|uniref:Fatty acid synthase n=1 Tax=Bursaphelenchus okinawaensis TaxID=465554 RepID=A0A811LHQ0_9BILA|nr:unnamed protein product [Bursaphelenchus okinawaensis]CAG9125753.1 unnamed protein product [Bursaphelenchus okinawaensis]
MAKLKIPLSLRRLSLVSMIHLEQTVDLTLNGNVFVTCEGRVMARGVVDDVVDQRKLNEDILPNNVVSTLFNVVGYEMETFLHEDFYNFMNNIGYEHRGRFRSVYMLKVVKKGVDVYGEVMFKSNLLDVTLDGLWQSMVFALLYYDERYDNERHDTASLQDASELLIPSFFGRIFIDKHDEQPKLGTFKVNIGECSGDFKLTSDDKVIVSGKNMVFTTILSKNRSADTKSKNEMGIFKDEQKEAMPNNQPVEVPRSFNSNDSSYQNKHVNGKAGIISTACRLPGNVRSIEDFWTLLTSKEVVSRRIPINRIQNRDDLIRGRKYGRILEGGGFLEEDISLFDAKLFGISEIEARAMDPQQRILLMCVYEAIERAGMMKPSKHEQQDSIGIYVGTMGSEYCTTDDKSALGMFGSSISFLSGRINYFLDSVGPSVVVDTACSSSLVALDMALQNLGSGRIQKAIVAGVNLILSEEAMGQRANGNLLSFDGICHSFDRKASGYGRSDGIVVIVLEMAKEDCEYEALLEDTNVNHDGRSAGLTAPNGNAHYQLIKKLITGRKVSFWECHGTGTALGDPIEVNALNRVLCDTQKEDTTSGDKNIVPNKTSDGNRIKTKVYLSTAKAWMGHTEATSGLVGILKAILQLKHDRIPGLPDFEEVNSQIKLDDDVVIAKEDVVLEGTLCGVSSFGVAGTNACAILSKSTFKSKTRAADGIGLIPISAKTDKALDLMLTKILTYGDFTTASVAFSLYRQCFTEHRAVICVRNGKPQRIPRYDMNFDDITCEIVDGESEDLYCRLNDSRLKGGRNVYYKKNNYKSTVILLQKLNEFGLNLPKIRICDKVYSTGDLNDKELRANSHLQNVLSKPNTLKITVSNKIFKLNSVDALQDLLAQAYYNVNSVNWNAFYHSNLSYSALRGIPTYQFDSKSYWKCKKEHVFDDPIVGNLTVEDTVTNTQTYEGYICKLRHSKLFGRRIDYGMLICVLKILSDYERFEIATVTRNLYHVMDKDVWMKTEITVAKGRFDVRLSIENTVILSAYGSVSERNSVVLERHDEYIGVKYNRDCMDTVNDIVFIDENLKIKNGMTFIVINREHNTVSAYCNNEFKNDKDEVLIKVQYDSEVPMPVDVIHDSFVSPPDTRTELSSLVASDVKQRIVSCVERATLLEFDVEKDSNKRLTDLGLDSLAMIGFVNELSLMDITVTSGDLAKYNTVNELVEFIVTKPQESGYSSSRNVYSPDLFVMDYSNEGTVNGTVEGQETEVNTVTSSQKDIVKDDKTTDKLSTLNKDVLYVLQVTNTFSKPDFTLRISLKGRTPLMTYKYLHTRSKVTFKGLLLKLNNLKPNNILIFFNSESEFYSKTVTSVFMELGKVLLSIKYTVMITVADTDGWLAPTGMAFIKSLAAESSGKLKYTTDKKLVRYDGDVTKATVTGTWIVTGGSSGIGWEMSKHLANEHDVEEVIIVSRSKPDMLTMFEESEDTISGCSEVFYKKIRHIPVDLTVYKDVQTLRKYLNTKSVKTVSVIHSAGVSSDVFFSRMTSEFFQKPLMAKCDGINNLVKALKGIHIDKLVLNSSVSSVFGNSGQSNYAVSNAYLDYISSSPTTLFSSVGRTISVNWGNWTEAGFAANRKTIQMLESKGFYGFGTEEALQYLDVILSMTGNSQIIVAKSNWKKMVDNRPDLKEMLGEVVKGTSDNEVFKRLSVNDINDDDTNSLLQKSLPTSTVTSEGYDNLVKQVIRSTLSTVLKVETSRISDNDGFLELGLDSIGMYSLASELNSKLKSTVTVVNLFEHYNIAKLSVYIIESTQKDSEAVTVPTKSSTASNKRLKDSFSSPSLDSQLTRLLERQNAPSVATKQVHNEEKQLPNLVFLFPGTFPLNHDLNWDLFSEISYLARQLRTCSEYFEDLLNLSIQKLITHRELQNLDLPVQQAIIFSASYSIAKFWMHCNLQPTYLLGHSLGELVAIAIAGYLDLKQATKLVVQRAKGLLKAKGKGQMIAAQREILSVISLEQLELDIAADNADNQIVLAGPTKSTERVMAEAESLGLVSKVLNADYPFHSKLIRDEYLKTINILSWRKVKENKITVISNVTARPLAEFNAKYVKTHAKSTVLFRESLDYVLSKGETIFLEVGLGHLLCSLVQKSLNRKNLNYLIIGSTVNGQKTLDLAKAKLELKGFDIDKKTFELSTGRPADLFDDLKAKHLSVRIKERFQRRLSEEIQGKDRQINPTKLLLHKRTVEVTEQDVEVIRDHILFDLPTAPAAFLIKCFIEHAKFNEFKMADIRLLSKLYIDDIAELVTNLDGQRLQLKNDNKLFASCLIAPKAFLEDPEFPSDDPGVRLNPQVFYNSLSKAGFHYGPSLRLISDIRLMTGNRIRTKCTAPKKPWISIDLALQSLSCGLFDPLFPCCYVPVRIGELYARLPLITDKNEWTFHGEIIKKDPQMVEGNIAAFSNGVLSVLIRDVKAVRMSRNTIRRPLRRNALSTDDELGEIQIVPPFFKKNNDKKREIEKKKETEESTRLKESEKKQRKDSEVKKEMAKNAEKATKEFNFLKIFSSFDDESDKKANDKVFNRSKLMKKLSNPERIHNSVSYGTLNPVSELNGTTSAPHSNGLPNNSDAINFRPLPSPKTRLKGVYICGYYGKFTSQSYTFVYEDFTEQSLHQDVLKLQYDYRRFTPEKFGLSAREVQYMDPSQRVLLLSAHKILEQLDLPSFPEDTGVFVAASSSDFAQKCFSEAEPSGYLMGGTNQSALSNRLSHYYRLKGPSVTVDTACASFSTALSLAVDNIRLARCSHALVAAVNLILNDKTTEVLKNAGVLSKHHRCDVFSPEAAGYLRSEGFGMILISNHVSKARYEVKDVSSCHVAGQSNGFYAPCKKTEVEVMTSVCSDDKVDLIECHGTGTVLGDTTELEAVNEYIRKRKYDDTVLLTSSKRYLGHSEGASGLASLLAVVSMMEKEEVPKMMEKGRATNVLLDKHIVIPRENVQKSLKKAMINNFGFTGTVNSILIEKLQTDTNVKEVSALEESRMLLWPFESEDTMEIEEITKKYVKSDKDVIERHVIRWNPPSEVISHHIMKLVKEVRGHKDVVIVVPKEYLFVVLTLQKTLEKEITDIHVTVRSEESLKPEYGFRKIEKDTIRHAGGEDTVTKNTSVRHKNGINKCFIVGGHGGVGRILLSVLNPHRTVIVGRRRTEEYPDTVTFYEADVSDYKYIKLVFDIEMEREAVDCVVNCAGVVDNVTVNNCSLKFFETTFEPKVYGTKNLLKLCKQHNVRRFICLSSVAALYGSYGQVNYSMANALMEEMVEESGLQYLILNLGPVKGAGMLYEDTKKAIRRQIEDSGWGFLTVEEVKEAFRQLRYATGQYKIIGKNCKVNNLKDEGCEVNNNVKERYSREAIQKTLVEIMKEISGLGNISMIKGLMTMGFDSLTVEQLRQSIQKTFNVTVEPVEMFENVYVDDIVTMIELKITSRQGCTSSKEDGNDEVLSFKPQKITKNSLQNKDYGTEVKMTSLCSTTASTSSQTEDTTTKIGIVSFSAEIPKCENEFEFFDKLLKGETVFDYGKRSDNITEHNINATEKHYGTKKSDSDDDYIYCSSHLPSTLDFDFSQFEISQNDIDILDNTIKYAVKHSYLAMEKAGYSVEQRKKLKIGVITCSEPKIDNEKVNRLPIHCNNTNSSSYGKDESKVRRGTNTERKVEPKKGSLLELYLANQKDFLALWVSHLLHLDGPSFSVYSACSSTLTAIHQAVSLLQTNVDMVVVTAVNLLDIFGHQKDFGNVLATECACRPFSRHATGTVKGSYCGSLVLKKVEDTDDIIAYINDIYINNDGGATKSNFMAPSVVGQTDCIYNVLNGNCKDTTIHKVTAVKCDGKDISPIRYVECHGTGTKIGDAIEVRAMKQAFDRYYGSNNNSYSSSHDRHDYRNQNGGDSDYRKTLIGSVKANIGHTFAASAMASIIKCLLILETGKIPRQINVPSADVIDEVKESCFKVPLETTTISTEDARVMINSFGIGGTNGTILLSKPKRNQNVTLDSTVTKDTVENRLIAGNASTSDTKDPVTNKNIVAKAFFIPISSDTVEGCTDNAKTVALYLQSMKDDIVNIRRVSYTLINHRQHKQYRACVFGRNTVEIIEKLQKITVRDVKMARYDHKIAYYMCHQGVEYPGILQNEVVDVPWLQNYFEDFVIDGTTTPLSGTEHDSTDPEVSSVTLYSLCHGIFRLLIDHGVPAPEVLIGHSLGEYTALAVAGAIEYDEGRELVRERGKLIRQTNKAKIVAIKTSEMYIEGLELSAVLSEHLKTFVASDDTRIQKLKDDGYEFTVLRGNYGFHSSYVTPIMKAFGRLLSKYRLRYCKLPVISTYDGKVVKDGDIQYLLDHLASPVRIDKALKTLHDSFKDVTMVVEVGPEGILKNILNPDIVHVATLPSYKAVKQVIQSEHRNPPKIVVISERDNIYGHLLIGLIDEYLDQDVSIIMYHVTVPSFQDTVAVATLLKTYRITSKGVPRYTYYNRQLHQQTYIDFTITTINTVTKPNSTVLFVGYGSLGHVLHKHIKLKFVNPEVLLMNRTKKELVDYIYCDLTDHAKIRSAVKSLFNIYKSVDYCIFLAGVKPSGDKFRSDYSKEQVMKPKMAVKPLLEEFHKYGITVANLILISSLSSVTGLPYTSEYTMANNFLDSLANNCGVTKINRVLSLQLPPLRDSNMLMNNVKLLVDNSVDIEKASEWVVTMMKSGSSGVYAYSNASPSDIRNYVRSRDKDTVFSHGVTEEDRKELLKDIWRQILNTEVDDDDDFYRIGGNSLNGLQLVWKVQYAFYCNITYDHLNDNPVFLDFYRVVLRHSTNGTVGIVKSGRLSGPLSYPQEQMYYLYKKDYCNYNITFYIQFEDTVDEHKLHLTLFKLLDVQKQLRTVFTEVNDDIRQDTVYTELAFNRSYSRTDQSLDTVLKDLEGHYFDLTVTAMKFIVGDTFVVVCMQHIITDGWSISLFADQFSRIYRGEHVRDTTVDYIDYSLHQREHYSKKKEAEYCNYLEELPSEGTVIWGFSLENDYGNQNGAVIERDTKDGTNDRYEDDTVSDSNSIYKKVLTVTEGTTRCLKQKASRCATSLFKLILTKFLLTLNRFKSEYSTRLVVGVPNAGRDCNQTSEVIGYFLNNWIVAVDVAEVEKSFEACLQEVDRSLRTAEYFSEVPYHKAVARSGRHGEHPVFQTFFNYRHSLEFPSIDLGEGVNVTVTQVNNNKTFPFSVTVDEVDDTKMEITVEWDPTVLHHTVISLFCDDFTKELSDNITVDTEIVEEEEPFQDVISMVLEQDGTSSAIRRPDGNVTTYYELYDKIRRHSSYIKDMFLKLTGRGITVEDVVVLHLDNYSMPEWILPVLYCGAAFCPINVNEPTDIVNNKLRILQNKLVISDKHCNLKVPSISTTYNDIAYYDTLPSYKNLKYIDTKNTVSQPCILPYHLAYVLFTSGTTGTPKAVQVEHSQLSLYLQKAKKDFNLNENTVIGSTVSFTFDVSMFNLFGTLCFGGTLVQKTTITEFVDTTDRFSHLFMTSAMFNSLSDTKIRSIPTDWLIVGGETPLTRKITVFRESGRRISQIYGPTEATVWTVVNHYEDTVEDGRIIGTSTTPFVVATPFSSSPRILNLGSIGELWILGGQVARGYTDSTPEFQEDVFGTKCRGFRSGDIVYQMPDRRLMYLGRTDTVKKIRGIRIDLLEIRNTVAKVFEHNFWLDVVDDVVVLVTEKGDDWSNYRQKLSLHLAEHQIPTKAVTVDKIPLNNNGKVDAHRVRDKIRNDVTTVTSNNLTSGVKSRLSLIWQRLLNYNNYIDANDNFFALGGHSLSLIRLQSHIQDEFNVNIPLSSLSQHAIFRRMVEIIDRKTKNIITVIREADNATKAVYCIHAIGGTVFPYYSMVNWWPKECNIYAIGYDENDEGTLTELAGYYHTQISRHATITGLPYVLFGHSLGGILAYEANILHYNEHRSALNVILVDSWVLENDKLNETAIRSYLQAQFEPFDNRDTLLSKSMKLCTMLKQHTVTKSPHPIMLFKARHLGNSQVNAAVRRDLTQDMLRSVIDNGWGYYCDDVTVIPTNGDHDSILQYLSEQNTVIQEILDHI